MRRPAVALAAALMLLAGARSGQADGHCAAHLRNLLAEAQTYEHGEGVARDPARAVALYCEGARLGDAEAQYSLGWMYANGRGVGRDDALAAYFFGLAAGQGHVQARGMLRYVAVAAAPAPDCMAEPAVAEPPGASSWPVATAPGPVLPEVTITPRDVQDLLIEATPEQIEIAELVNRLAPRYGVYPRLALAVIRAESNFKPLAQSAKNAQGLMQLIPDTAERFNVRNVFDKKQNIRGGLAYLRWLLAYFQGNVPLVVAGYNAGERAVDRYRGVPPYPETQEYVRRIKESFQWPEHPYDPAVTKPSPQLARMRLEM